LNAIYKRDLKPISELERAGDVKHSLASLTKIQKVLGYRPIVNFEEGLRLTVEAEAGN
jgi:nucleoside-diphosphate-sugar epimerase